MLYKLNFLMTAIRKTTLQVAYFQVFTNLTTELYTSNDRFGFNAEASGYVGKTMTVMMPIMIENVQNDYTFTFNIDKLLNTASK